MAKGELKVNLPAALAEVAAPPEPGDELLTVDELAAISLFRQVKKAPAFDKFPGTTLLRRCYPGRVMCQLGESGATAFFILTTEDVLEMREKQLELLRGIIASRLAGVDLSGDGGHQYLQMLNDVQLREREQELYLEINQLRQRIQRLEGVSDPADNQRMRRVASARLLVKKKPDEHSRPPGLLGRIAAAFRRNRGTDGLPYPTHIPIDGPADIDFKTLTAPLNEAELFGEMSCLNRMPRSATIIVEQECYMLEMLRNVLNSLHRDPVFKEQMDDIYRRRVFESQIRTLPIFEELGDDEYARLKEVVELDEYESGSVIFEERQESDCLYLIRSGLVKVMLNAWYSLNVSEFKEGHWDQLFGQLAEFAGSAEAVPGAVWGALKPDVRKLISQAAAAGSSSQEERARLVDGLNEFIRGGTLHTTLGKSKAEIEAIAASPHLRANLTDHAEDPANWSQIDARMFHRILLEVACPGGCPRRDATAGPKRNLTYLGKGDFIGEIGLMLDRPRTATCIAYDHPDSGFHQRLPDSRTGAIPSRVELVKLGKSDFLNLVNSFPRLKSRVKKLVEERDARSRKRSERKAGDITAASTYSADFEQLGLIQGQKLMLIDLERCTRCGCCVDACVNAHRDGRTRLYLDGPRFEKYLVPITCRECLDPVCMIGCPVGSITRGDNGEIQIRDWCIGCSLCADQCPYGSIQMTELDTSIQLSDQERLLLPPDAEIKAVTEQAVVCDLCSTLPSQDPACVYACPHDAALRVNSVEFFLEPLEKAGAASIPSANSAS